MTAPRLAAGQVVAGKYQVLAMLGDGGSSATYRAATSQGREVALRLFDPAIGQRSDVIGAIHQASSGTNALPAEATAHVVDAGYDPQTGAPFVARELCPVMSLAQVAPRRPLAVEAMARLLATLGRTLDSAHARGLFHHALKPHNLFLDAAAPDGVRVTDFGASLARSALPTQEGYAEAAPWMAPEQAQNAAAGVPADVFAAGLCAFFAVTGRSYWRSCQGAAPDIAAWQRELMSPRMPASARAGELGVPLPASLDAIFQRALAIDPGDRFRSVSELATAMQGALGAGGSAQTMAFPSSAFQPPAGYPGAEGAYPAAAAAAPARPEPHDPRTAQGAPPVQERSPDLALTALPATPAAPSKAVPIVIAVVAVLLLAAGAAAFVLLRKPKAPDTGPIAISAQSGAVTVPAADSASAAPSASAAEPPPAASAEPSATPDAGPAEVEVTVTCDPPCEEISADGKRATDPSAALKLAPGAHKITVGKPGYVPQTATITVEPDKPMEKTFALVAIAGPGPKPAGPSTGTGPKPCGKFLKRCK